MQKTLLIILMLFVLLPCSANSKPEIESVSNDYLVNNSTVSVFGNGFGKKKQSKPLVFENFESNSKDRQYGDIIAGKKCSHYGQWKGSTYNFAPVYTNIENRNGSKLCSYHYLEGGKGVNHAPLWIDFSDKNEPVLLVSYWTKFSYTVGSDDSWQLKYFRITNGVSDIDNDTYFQELWWTNRPPSAAAYCFFFMQPTRSNPHWPNYSIQQGYADTTLDFYKPVDKWHNYTLLIKQSDSNVANGIVKIWIDGKLVCDESAMATFVEGKVAKSATFMWYLGNNEGEGKASVYFDDIYIDNSWASIWIGDKQNWNDCVHKEVQIPVKWPRVSYATQDRIDFTVNKGSFKSGAQAFIFIMNEDGVISNGKSVKFE